MNVDFFPTLSNLLPIYRSSQLHLSIEHQTQIKDLHLQMQQWLMGLSCCWGGLLALDIKNFFLKDKPKILKIFRTRYHLFSAFGFSCLYIYLDYKKGFKVLDILSQYDPRYLTLKQPNSSF